MTRRLALAIGLLGAAAFVPAPVALAQSPGLQLPAVADHTCPLASGESEKTCQLTLPEATGGIGSVSYSLSHQDSTISLPSSLFGFDSSTRELTTTAQPRYQTKDGWALRYRAEDDDGNVASADFVVTIDGSPTVAEPSEQNFTVGKAIQQVRIRTSGNGELTASLGDTNCFNAPPPHDSLTPDFQNLPGLTIGVDNERVPGAPAHVTISGTPTQPGECNVKITVTDGDGQSTTTSSFKVFFNAVPDFDQTWPLNAGFTVGQTASFSITEPALGNGKWDHHTLAWEPALPSWLTFTDSDPLGNSGPNYLKLEGKPPAPSTAQIYTLTLTDYGLNDHFGRNSGTYKVCISATSAPSITDCGGYLYLALQHELTQGRRMVPLTMPEALFGSGAKTYTLSGLPKGLGFNSVTRQLSGTPGASGTFRATYRASDAGGESHSISYQITVNGPLSFSGVEPSRLDFTKGATVATPLPEAKGGYGVRSYSVSGLPAGVSFDPSSRTLSGAPTSVGNFSLVLTATDENGASASLTFAGSVHPPPSFPPQSLTLGFPGPADTLPAARGGFGALTYELACRAGTPTSCDSSTGLPHGLTFDKETRTVSGNFATGGLYFLKLTATDRNDATGAKDLELRVAGIIVQAYDTTGAAIPGLTIPVPEEEGDSNKAAYYTLALAVAPGDGNSVTIKLSGPSGDNDLQYFDPDTQPREFTWAGNNFVSQGRVTLFAAEDDGGENGRATIRHTVTSDDGTYNGITFVVTLVEVDNDPSIVLSLDPASLAENKGETEVTVNATVVAPEENSALNTLPEATSIALGRTGGTATEADYTAAFSESLEFDAGDTSATAKFTFTPVNDNLYEPDETVVVAGTAWPTGPATLTITDDDEPTPSADCGNRVVTEGGGGRTIHVICTVTLRDANGNPVAAKKDETFNYVTVAGTATADEDYEHATGSVTIKGGQTSARFLIAVYDDDEQESTERFTVEFSGSPIFASVGIDIRDDDSPAPPPSIEHPTEEEEEEEVSGPDDAYRATVAFGATAYTASEGGQAATIAVRLHPAPPDSRSVSIPVSGRGGRGVTPDDWQILVDAAAGDSWNAAAGAASVVFAPGETERTFALEAVDDDHFEGNETLTLTFDADRLPEGVTADPEAAEAVVTLVDDDFTAYRGRVLKQVLAAFGRTVASDAVMLLTGRMDDDAPGAGSRASLVGQTLRLDGASLGTATLAEAGPAERGVGVLPDAFEPWRAPGADPRTRSITARELLTGSSFRYRLGASESDGLGFGGAWTLWGEGGTASFSGRPETDFSLDGEAASGWLGVDWRREPAVVGISMSHYRGSVDYEASVADGDVEIDLMSVFPYARWSLADMDLWGVAGLGAGRLELTDSFGGNQSDLTMQLAAAGARRTIRPAGEHGISLAAKADGFAVRLASEARGLGTQAVGDDLPAVNARAGRLRVALEAGYVRKLASGAVLRPTVDLGARLDSGDADSGAGVDLAGGVLYESPSGRLTLEGRGRVLLAHAASGFQEWAAGGLVRLAPEAGGRGLSLSVAPSWGMAGSRTGVLWDGDLPGAQGESGARVATEIGYGLPAFKGHGLLTPWAGTELAQDRERAWRAGMRLELRSDLALKLQGSHRENRDGEREQEIGMRLSFGF